jgi:ribosome-associated heat shock protein Hsp15
MHGDNANEETRIDTWLWAARFFKTRALAAEAVNGSQVEVNGARTKLSRTVKTDDELSVRQNSITPAGRRKRIEERSRTSPRVAD